VDSAESTAQAAARQLGASASGESSARPATHFFVTDSVEKFRRLGGRFLGQPVTEVEHVDLPE
jgi:glutamate racemase